MAAGSTVPTLQTLAMDELVSCLQATLSMPLSYNNVRRIGVYLCLLPSRHCGLVVEKTLVSRPMWVPIDYHWASLELDPVLLLLSLEPIGGSMRDFAYPCHPLNRDVLLRAISTMTCLKSLTLEESCDNETLGVVGATCRHLNHLNVAHSRQVNDDGVRRLCLKRTVYMRRKWQNVVGRLKGLSLKLGSGHTYHQLHPSKNHDPEDLNPLCRSLKHVNIVGTKVTELGVLYLRAVVPNLSVLLTE